MSTPHLRLAPEQAPRVITPDIAEKIAKEGLPLVRKLAAKHARANDLGLDESDFFSRGQSVLTEVAPGFEEGHDARFTTYIFPFVDGAMKDEIRHRRLVQKVDRTIARELEREGRQFASIQSDKFDVLHNTRENTIAQLDDTMSELAARLTGTAVVTARVLQQRGTQEGLREAQRHDVAVQTLHEAIPKMAPKLQELWQLHYEEGLQLQEYAMAVGISIATAKLNHRKFKDQLREILTEKACG